MTAVSAQIWRRALRTLADLTTFADAEGMLTLDESRALQSMARDAQDILRRSAPRKAPAKSLPRRSEEKRAAKEARNAVTSRVRAAVWARSGGRCESCKAYLGHLPGDGHLDHFRGGASRRASNTVEGAWRLCLACDDDKTNNRPSRRYWVVTFAQHGRDHGYAATILATNGGEHT